jgi:small conductance mechanosensitive channel
MDWVTDVIHSLYGYLTGKDLWVWIGKTVLRIGIIIILAYVCRNIGYKVIDTIFKDRRKLPLRLTTSRREQTLKNLLSNVLSYIIVFIVILMILDTFHVPIRTMLAGAGIAGFAIGFGAQNLVKDVIGGFFIIFEDHFSVGDYIEIGKIEGEVEMIGLRSTKLRSYYGQQYVIQNGNIEVVTNYSVRNGFAMVEINVPYEEDIVRLEDMVEEVLETLPGKYEMFVGTPEINGVQALELSNYVLRIRAETIPVMQWAGARVIRKEVKERLFEEGIEIPSPRMVVYSNDDRKVRNDSREIGAES